MVVWSDCEELLQTKQLQIPPDDILDIYVPGRLRCQTCKFELTKATLFVQSGQIGASKAEVYQQSEPCPNDGEPMVRVTWREEADANRQYAERLIDDVIQATGTNSLPAAMAYVKGVRESQAVEPSATLERSWEGFAEERSGMLAAAPLGFARQAFYAGAQSFLAAMNAALDENIEEQESTRRMDAVYAELVQSVEAMKL